MFKIILCFFFYIRFSLLNLTKCAFRVARVGSNKSTGNFCPLSEYNEVVWEAERKLSAISDVIKKGFCSKIIFTVT